MNTYFTVKGEYENTTVIEKSKFICYIKGIENETEAKDYIEYVRKKHSFAKHNCYAYIADEMGLNQKFSDAGEPQGTAGMPMLTVLKSKKIYKTIAVVARYFGGIKLGTGGLTRAYGGAVSECLKKAQIVEITPVVFTSVITDYDGYSKIINVSDNGNYKIIKTDFDSKVMMSFAVKNDSVLLDNFNKNILDLTKGKAEIKTETEGFYPF